MPRTLPTLLAITAVVPLAALPGQAADALSTPENTGPSANLTVTAERLDQLRNQITPSLGASTYDITPAQIATQSQGADAPFNQVLLRAPGVAEDSYGQLHVRGEHANLQYRLNGVLLPEGLTGFGQELDTRAVDSVRLITGALPAEYGQRTAGVIDIRTRSGIFDPGGDIGVYGGSHETVRPHCTYGMAVGRLDAFATIGYDHTALGIENPTGAADAMHDRSDQYRGLADVSYLIDPSSRLTLIVAATDNSFQIPANPDQSTAFTLNGQPGDYASTRISDHQREQSRFAILAYQKSLGPCDLQCAAFTRRSAVAFHPDRTGDLLYNGVASSIDQSADAVGVQADASCAVGTAHTLRGGGTYSETRARLGTSTAVFATDASGAQSSSDPRDIIDDHRRHADATGVYVQDEWRVIAPLTINGGLRFDRVAGQITESQFSPRINATVAVDHDTTIHAGYARYFTPPPLESVPTETLAAFANTTNAPANSDNDPVRAERSHYVDLGISHRVIPELQVGLDGYYKSARHQLDEGQFGQALIFTPFNYRTGTVTGVEGTATFATGDFTAYTNLAWSQATAREIESAQFAFDRDELAYIENHEVHVDHDQTWTLSTGAAYVIGRTTVYGDALGGTGLRRGFANTESQAPYLTVNLGATRDLGPCTVRLDIVNLFDRTYALRDGSGIGVGAPQFGQRRGFYGGVFYRF